MGNPQQSYTIGQVIYILSNKSQSVIPAIVAEETTHKVRKLDGIHEIVNYKLCVGPKDKQQMIPLSKIDGDVFFSIDEVRVTLINRLTAFVDEVVTGTNNKVQNWYGISSNNNFEESISNDSNEKLDPEQIINAVSKNNPIQMNNNSNLRNDLKMMLSEDNAVDIILPDGTKTKAQG